MHIARPRGVTPHPRSGAVAESARLRRGRNGREELPHALKPEARGVGREDQLHVQGAVGGCMGAGGPRRAIPRSRSEGTGVRRYPSSKVRSSGCALLEQL